MSLRDGPRAALAQQLLRVVADRAPVGASDAHALAAARLPDAPDVLVGYRVLDRLRRSGLVRRLPYRAPVVRGATSSCRKFYGLTLAGAAALREIEEETSDERR